MSNICFIYELIDPNNDETRYIGKTLNLDKRLYEHIWEAQNNINKSYKNNWIKSLLDKGLKPILNVIDEVFEYEWKFWEEFYINLYKSWECNLTNLTNGGEGVVGFRWNEQQKESRSKLMKGKPKPEGFSEQLKIRMLKTGKERGIKISKSKNVAVLQLDNQTEKIINRFNSIKEAQEKTGIYNISVVCLGKRLLAGNFKWKFEEDVI